MITAKQRRWNDNDLEDDHFEWLAAWRSVLPGTIASAQILYKQLLPTNVSKENGVESIT